MKWYLAARTKNTDKLISIGEFLKSQGHEVASDWIYITDNVKPFSQNIPRVQEITENNLQKMLGADIFLLFNDTEGRDTFVEFGVCLASKAINRDDKRLYIVGDVEKTSLMQNHASVIHCKTLQEVFDKEGIEYTDFTFPEFE